MYKGTQEIVYAAAFMLIFMIGVVLEDYRALSILLCVTLGLVSIVHLVFIVKRQVNTNVVTSTKNQQVFLNSESASEGIDVLFKNSSK